MVANVQDIHRLTLMVLRLMDADILPPAEGNALLAEMHALEATMREAAERESGDDQPLHPAGEALVQTDRLGASPPGTVPESVHQPLPDALERD